MLHTLHTLGEEGRGEDEREEEGGGGGKEEEEGSKGAECASSSGTANSPEVEQKEKGGNLC
jgi:hypothetical protein